MNTSLEIAIKQHFAIISDAGRRSQNKGLGLKNWANSLQQRSEDAMLNTCEIKGVQIQVTDFSEYGELFLLPLDVDHSRKSAVISTAGNT